MSEKWELIGKQGMAIWCGDEVIAQVTEPRVDHGKKRKRAQLIASAPDLLAMLERIRDDKTFRTNDNALWPDLLSVIKKAQGAA